MNERAPKLALVLSLMGAAFAALVPGCQSPRDENIDENAGECTACHGNSARAGSKLVRAAPPTDTQGNKDPAFPGVGAHSKHIFASPTHAAIPCAECHVVPESVNAKGHLDDALPAEVVLSGLAAQGGLTPSYDFSARHCSDTYCHKDSDAVWNQPRTSDAACGSCHGVPPPVPHPQNPSCHLCHGEVIGENGFVKPELHVNGKLERGSGKCDFCHGSDGVAAPPKDLGGNTSVTALGVGAHRVHLAGGDSSRAVQCSECHTVPSFEDEPGHRDTPLPAEVIFYGVASNKGRKPAWDRQEQKCADAWCHSPDQAGQKSPLWTSDAGRLPCNGCHGTPPAPPHPQMTDCSRCHGAVVADDDKSIKDRSKHVDGVINVVVPTSCTGCHGSTSPAPPADLAGNTNTTSPGVGAHQAHLVGSGRARKVACAECHVVPSKWDDPGHADTLQPAELTFSGVAVTGGLTPTYTSGSCQKTYCHGGFADSAGSVTAPVWTKVDGTQSQCGTCHGMPPVGNHTSIANCYFCHPNVDTSLKIIAPETHVDGIVTKP
ncbi:MAG: CxxxxCH/CxxCH domain-containing protein [Polyangiaceae bacterium]